MMIDGSRLQYNEKTGLMKKVNNSPLKYLYLILLALLLFSFLYFSMVGSTCIGCRCKLIGYSRMLILMTNTLIDAMKKYYYEWSTRFVFGIIDGLDFQNIAPKLWMNTWLLTPALNFNDILDNHLSRGNSGNRGVNHSEGLHMLPLVCLLREIIINILEDDKRNEK